MIEEQPKAARRWSAYVCPDCRFLFRVPRDHDGEGIVCPSCRRMLRIPGEEEATAPLMAPLKKIGFSEDENPGRGEKRRRATRKKKDKEIEIPGWEASAGKWRATRKKGKRVWRSAVGWAALFVIGTGLVFLLLKLTLPTSVNGAVDAGVGAQDDFDDLVSAPLLLPDEELEEKVELPKVMKRSEKEFLDEAEPLAKTFLNASTVEELLAVVYDPKRMRPKIAAYYPGGKVQPEGMKKFNASGRVSYKGDFAAVSVLTSDYDQKQLAYIDGADGLKIDWESWVGWSEMRWDELLVKRPTEPTLVRVMMKWIEYYNFEFSDESKWRSYRLTAPDGETMIYGYAARNSLLDQRMRPAEAGMTVACTLRVSFPKGDGKAGQVVIDEYVSDGWVIVPKNE